MVASVAYVSGCTSIESSCSVNAAIAAENEASSLRNWAAMYESFRRYRYCDDGAVAEGYGESVSKLLAEQWETLSDLQDRIAMELAFQTFVVHHINEMSNRVRIDRIEKNASERCPPNAKQLCDEIIVAVRKVKK